MGFIRIFWKNNIQEVYLPKTSISGQIVSEILAQLCSNDSIQILLNLTQFIALGTESNIDVVLSEYPDKSHNYHKFNPFAPEPPITARADPRPFYPLWRRQF